MKEVFEQVITLGNYDLKTLLANIDQYHIEGRLTDEERLELTQQARKGAQSEYDYAGEIDALWAAVRELQEMVKAPAEDETWPEFVQPTHAGTAYHTGDRVTFNGERLPPAALRMEPGRLSRRMGETGMNDCPKRQSFLYTVKGGFCMRNITIDLVWAKIQTAVTALGGILGYFVGGLDGLLTALIILMVLDYITGVMCAIVDRTLSSAVGFKGIFKKVLIFMLVGVAHIMDMHVIGTGDALRSAVICFYLSNEGVSLLENAGHLGLPIPEKLKAILAQLHDKLPDADSTTDPDDGE